MASKTSWKIDADYIQACNCDYGCPCEFSAPPTLGYCEGIGAWKINNGSFGGVKLDGLGVGFAAHWPKAIHEGNGTICLFIDEKASQEQREALITICTGQAGGLPFEILATTFTKLLDPQFVKFDFKMDGAKSTVRMGKEAGIALSHILNPVTKEPESVRVEHATGFIFKGADCYSAKEMSVEAPGLKFSWPEKAAFTSRVQYSNG